MYIMRTWEHMSMKHNTKIPKPSLLDWLHLDSKSESTTIWALNTGFLNLSVLTIISFKSATNMIIIMCLNIDPAHGHKSWRESKCSHICWIILEILNTESWYIFSKNSRYIPSAANIFRAAYQNLKSLSSSQLQTIWVCRNSANIAVITHRDISINFFFRNLFP